MRTAFLIILGVIVGAIGATLYRESFPPDPNTAAARAAELEQALIKTQRRLAALEANAKTAGPSRVEISESARSVVEDFKDGRPVDVDDIYQTAKPILRDLAPVFDAMRRREQKKAFDGMIANLTERYQLNAAQQAALKKWMEQKAEQEAARFRDLALKENTRIEDLAKAAQQIRPAEGLDAFMEGNLSGETLDRFRSDRLKERAANVQNEAERKVDRLNAVVALDDTQQDQVFALMARSSRDFDPAMKLDGLGGDTTLLAPGQSRDEAIMAVLRPEQKTAYEQHRARQRQEAEERMNEMGLKLPSTWDFFQDQ
ncbi:MAG: hypothetical protein ACR2OZ_09835 [Verrucomicrobiales bacterium]